MKEKITQPNNQFIWLARLYSNVFRGEEWQEWFKKDDQFYPRIIDFDGNKVDLALSWNQLGFERAYPLRETAEYIKAETSRKNSVLVIKSDTDSKVPLGFGWGYSYNQAEDLISEKWSYALTSDRQWLTTLVARYVGGLQKPLWYLSEVGVRKEIKNKGIGTEIVKELIRKSSNMPIIMRTNIESSMSYIAQKLGFAQIMGPACFRDEEFNIIPNQPIIGGKTDPLNPSRVLFVKNANEYYPNYLRQMLEGI